MDLASKSQAINGVDNKTYMSPLRVKQAIQANKSGEGSGTSNYNDLENKPKINGVTLEGDKSSSDLGISVPSVDEETIIKSPNLTAIGVKESSGNIDHFLTLTLSEYNAIENKDPNTFYNITDDTDPSAIPTKTSDLVNDSGFITSSYHDNTKQDVINDLETIRSNAALGATLLPVLLPMTINEEYVYNTDLSYIVVRIGKIVILDIRTIGFKSVVPHGGKIIYGLPPAKNGVIFYLFGGNSAKGDTTRVFIGENGEVNVHYGSNTYYGSSPSDQYSGRLVYETID